MTSAFLYKKNRPGKGNSPRPACGVHFGRLLFVAVLVGGGLAAGLVAALTILLLVAGLARLLLIGRLVLVLVHRILVSHHIHLPCALSMRHHREFYAHHLVRNGRSGFCRLREICPIRLFYPGIRQHFYQIFSLHSTYRCGMITMSSDNSNVPNANRDTILQYRRSQS